jgi:hypothetical protein
MYHVKSGMYHVACGMCQKVQRCRGAEVNGGARGASQRKSTSAIHKKTHKTNKQNKSERMRKREGGGIAVEAGRPLVFDSLQRLHYAVLIDLVVQVIAGAECVVHILSIPANPTFRSKVTNAPKIKGNSPRSEMCAQRDRNSAFVG